MPVRPDLEGRWQGEIVGQAQPRANVIEEKAMLKAAACVRHFVCKILVMIDPLTGWWELTRSSMDGRGGRETRHTDRFRAALELSVNQASQADIPKSGAAASGRSDTRAQRSAG